MDFALIDLIVVGAVALFALLGVFSGFILQLYGVLALIAAWFLAAPVGRIIADFITARSQTPPAAAYVIGCFAAGIGVYTCAKILFRIVHHFLKKAGTPLRKTDRVLGGLFGGAKAFAIAWIVLCLVAAFPDYFRNKKPDLSAMLEESRMGRLVEQWNPVKKSRVVGAANALVKIISRDPQALEQLTREPEIAEFAAVLKKKLAERAPDDQTARQIQAGDLSELRNMSTVLSILKDPEVTEALQKVDLNAALTRAARQAE